MRIVARCDNNYINIKADAVELREDTLWAFRKRDGELTANEFAGMWSLGSVDYIYTTEEKG